MNVESIDVRAAFNVSASRRMLAAADRHRSKFARVMLDAFRGAQARIDLVPLQMLLASTDREGIEQFMERPETLIDGVLLRAAASSPVSNALLNVASAAAGANELCVTSFPMPQATLTREQQHALTDYANSSSVNRYLRDSTLKVPAGPAEQIAYIREALAKAPLLDKPITVWRGLSGDFSDMFAVGNTVEMAGFQSTTLNRDIVTKFAITRFSTVLEITTTRGLSIDAFTARNEAEFLLGHNWRYRVTGIKTEVFKGETRKVIQLVVE